MMKADAARLREMILQAVLTNEAVEEETTEHGTRYTVDFQTLGLKGEVTIRSAWIIDAGGVVPRLTNCFVKGKKQ